ncbi:MAG: Ig-like domain-containing protein [Bacteroidales bacterium]
MKRSLLIIFTLSLSLALTAQVIKPFKIAYQKTQRGGIVYLANVGLKTYSKDSTAMPPDNGVSNNQLPSQYLDIDNDPSTFMSSSDSLNLPDCSDISYVGLYWGGAASKINSRINQINKIKFKANNDSYIDLVADAIVDSTSSLNLWGGSYFCFKNLTDLFKTSASKYNNKFRATLANIVSESTPPNLVGTSPEINKFSGWSIVIAYKNELQNLRQLTIYDGLSYIGVDKPPIEIPFTGFQTPKQGAVTFEIGHFSWDGDRDVKGDSLSIKSGLNNTYNYLYDTSNSIDNIFNSTISNKGVLTPFRKPSYNNNFCIDADVFSPDNSTRKYIGWGDISMTLKLTTGKEAYLTQVVTLAIDAYIPDNRLGMRVKKIPKIGDFDNIVRPGDTLEYTFLGNNVGTDKSQESYIYTKIERNANFVPGSLRIKSGPNAGVKSDAAGDDQAFYDPVTRMVKFWVGTGANGTHGGLINYDPDGKDSTVVSFRVTATSNCLDLQCDNVIDTHGFIHGQGLQSGAHFESDQVPQYFDDATCTINEISNKSSVIVFQDCPPIEAKSNSPVCEGSDLNLVGTYSPNATYSWTGPDGFTSNEQNPVIKNVYSSYNAGKYTLTLTLTDASCAPFVLTTDVVVKPTNSANAGVDQSICTLTTQLKATAPASGTGKWSFVGVDPSVIISSETSATTRVSFKKPGVYKFEWKLPDVCSKPDTVTISVGVNCPLVITNETHTIKVDSTATRILTINDTSFDNKFVVNTLPVVGPKHGDVSINSNGSYTYTPRVGYVGKDTVVVNVCDTQTSKHCANDTVFVTVIPLDPFILVNEHRTIVQDGQDTGNLTTNDTSKNQCFHVTKKTNPLNGNVTVNDNGSYTYKPFSGFSGKDQFIVTVCNCQIPQQCGVDTVFIDVTPLGALILKNERDTISVGGVATGVLTTNDISKDQCFKVNKTVVVPPQHGNFIITNETTYTYTPNAGYIGKDMIVVNICDCQSPAKCANDTVFITVNPLGSKPVAHDDVYTVTSGKLAENDELSQNGPNIWTKVTDPPVGSVVVNSDGTFVYTPPTPDYSGTVTFTYRITDANNKTSDATVTITITPIFVPGGYSPNGDGKHDKLVINGLDAYPQHIFTIFNRWGNKVFEAHPYLNDWDGTNMFGVTYGGRILPNGTYFYILELGTGYKTLKGVIYLSR